MVTLTLDRCNLLFDHIIAREDAPQTRSDGDSPFVRNVGRVALQDIDGWRYLYDLLAGREAGTKTALVTHGRNWDFAEMADFVWPSLMEGLEEFRRELLIGPELT